MRAGWIRSLSLWAIIGLTGPAGPLIGAAPGAGSTPGVSAGPSAGGDRKVRVALLAEQPALVPGETIALGVKFTIADPWHIYWQNAGDSGLPPSFDWTLPEGFEVAPMQFPAPEREIMPGDLHTFILHGEPMVLTTLKVPESAQPGEDVEVAVASKWLVCTSTTCVPEDGRATLTLPVVASKAEVKPKDDKAFEETQLDFKVARRALPVPPDKAEHLERIQAVADVEGVKPGEAFKVAVIVSMPEGIHINAYDPGIDDFVGTDVFPHSVEGLFIEPVEFPEGKRVSMPGFERPLSVYAGKAVFIIPVSPGRKLEGETITVSGVLRYQACSDKTKQCYRPMAAQWGVKLPILREGDPKPVNRSVFQHGATVGDVALTIDSEGLPIAWSQGLALAPGGPTPGGPSVPVTFRAAEKSLLARITDYFNSWGFIGWLCLAALGGFILNLMPCVLPVISIKVLSFVKQAGEHRARILALGLAFASGIVVSFIVLGALILLLNQQWGGLFQSPYVVIALAAVVTAFALSLFGVFTLFPPKIVNELGGQVQSQEGPLGAFGMGLLATLLGTACTAPFLSAVIAIATQQPIVLGFLIFLAAGLGMAFPYVLLAAKPAWVKFIPKPGPWMQTFEQLMGFLLLGTVIWLVNPLPNQIGGRGLLWTLVFLLFVALGVWFYGRVEFGASADKKLKNYGAAAFCIVAGWLLSFSGNRGIAVLIEQQRELRLGGTIAWDNLDWSDDDIPWVPYTRQRALMAVEQGYTVFVDYTADWCASCKSNEAVAINTRDVRRIMQENNVIPFEADYTSYDPEITEDLKRFGRSGVPMYVIYPAGRPDEAILLDELLTSDTTVVNSLRQAGPSRVRPEISAEGASEPE